MTSVVDRTNEELVSAIAVDRDRTAFAALFRQYGPKIESYALRNGAGRPAAEELVQDVMLTVWLRADSFNPALASVGTWIFTIARNRRIDRIRKETRPEIDPNDPALLPVADLPADRVIELSEDRRILSVAMNSLSPEQSEVLRLSYFEGKTQTEIAEERNIPLGTVKTRLRLALGHLKRTLQPRTV